MSEQSVHEVYAVKFGQNVEGKRGHFFVGDRQEPHDESMQLDYLVWLIRSEEQDIIFDAGFTAQTNLTRNRDHWENPSDALRRMDVDVEQVKWVALSHMHYDHIGDLAPFASASFIVQEEEMAFWTGRFAPRKEFAKLVELEDIERLIRLNYDGRVKMIDGTHQITDGVRLHKVGGHTPGMQVMSVNTVKGTVVLAADASHFFENVQCDSPFAVHTNMIDMYRTFDTMNDLADSGLVMAGHDPKILKQFPAVAGQEGHVARIA